MTETAESRLLRNLRQAIQPLDPGGAAQIAQRMAKSHIVMIGEATHGTDEFYRLRAEITKCLIRDHGFAAVTVEGDWPDCYRVNRYVRGAADISRALGALSDFQRFPAWMWRNPIVADFIDWLRAHNAALAAPQDKAGFYGLDLYSLYASIEGVIAYLDAVDPASAARARRYYACFDHGHRLAQTPQAYGQRVLSGVSPDCERQAIEQLAALRRNAALYMRRDGFAAGEAYFCADRNAEVALRAEQYYRAMFQGRAISWNLRDKHMADTLFALCDYLGGWRGEKAKLVVWAHNSHIGDARATEMSQLGEWNLGQLVREARGDDAFLLGMSTYAGEVTAASAWDGDAERKRLRPALPGSYEHLFHLLGQPDFFLPLRGDGPLQHALGIPRLQRAVGVVYLPESERTSHYVLSRLPRQFDAITHIDETSALAPLEPRRRAPVRDLMDAYPSGI
jgi:erythromycin esterase-like protein